jgi:preprotein translocase subunit YajC
MRPLFATFATVAFALANPVFAEPAAPSPMDLAGQFLPMVVIFVLFWFILIRPQMKRAKEHKQMVDGLQVGDEVVTGGGVLGRVTKVSETYLTLEIAKDTRIVVQRPSIQTVLPKGTIASA